MGGSSSQPRTDPPRSSINAFPIEELYTLEFLESLQDNTAYWQEPNPYEAAGERVATSPTKKKATRNRQKRAIQIDDAPRQTAWTTEKEIALAKGWRAISENSQHGNARKKYSFWCEVLAYIESKKNRKEIGAGDEYYVQRALIHYQDETGVPFKFRHCWDVLKDSPKFQEITFPNFNQGSEGSSKRHKKFDDPRAGKKRAAAKNKGSKASGSSTMNDDALVRLMVNEMTSADVQQRDAFMELKRREVECREREIAATKYRAQQEDIKLYRSPYDHLTGEQRLAMDEIRAKIKAKYNLQY
ncbi:hypothetical protein Tco_1451234 [Tanacetum coccineum]